LLPTPADRIITASENGSLTVHSAAQDHEILCDKVDGRLSFCPDLSVSDQKIMFRKAKLNTITDEIADIAL
jgi:hypothetical protein